MKLQRAAFGGVGERQLRGVQPLAGQPEPSGQRGVGAVGEVADARVAYRRHVHPDLVGAAGLEPDVEQARGAEGLDASRSG